jgi:PmbA protein
MEVVLSQETASEILEFTVVPSILGDNMHRGESVYSGRIGEAVGVKGLNIYDDPLDPKGEMSGTCDDEGVPSVRTDLVRDGVLVGALYDTDTAYKYKAEPTSSGLRAERLSGGQSFRSQPTTCARNFTVTGKGAQHRDKIVRDIDNGIYVREVMGAHTANSTSGDFSVMASTLFRIRKGEIKEPLRAVMISGNGAEALKRISAIGTDPRHLGGSLSSIGTCLPTIAVEGLNVTP